MVKRLRQTGEDPASQEPVSLSAKAEQAPALISMEKKSSYHCRDGRSYDVTMAWDEKFKDSDKVFRILFKAVDRETGRALNLPREIATYQIGTPDETLGDRVTHYYGGNRELLMTDYLTTAYRRATDWIERGK